jgi:hypothetical protein
MMVGGGGGGGVNDGVADDDDDDDDDGCGCDGCDGGRTLTVVMAVSELIKEG